MSLFDAALYDDGPVVRNSVDKERRRQVVRILEAALRAVDPYEAVCRVLRVEGDTLWVGDLDYTLSEFRHIYVVGAGKAGAPMVRAVEDLLGERVSGGHVNVKVDHAEPTRFVQIHEAGHPIPDEAGLAGATEIARLLRDTVEEDLVLCLISGGGSALMTLPVEGVSLADIKALTDSLLHVGATINEINTIRKHLSQLKGGHLARLAAPARVVSLILSDVVGNPLDVIASGPTVPDTSTFADAWDLLRRYELLDEIPSNIREHLRRGVDGQIAETPKAGDPLFARTQNVIVASNDLAARAAEAQAQELGFNTLILSTFIEGEAREVAKVQAALAKEVLASGRPAPRPACLISGGETTVTVRGKGMGGRNQEMALMAAIQIAGLDDVAVIPLATDGTDGPTDASGAYADGRTVARVRELGLDPWAYLQDNDSYHFFAPLGDLLLTGPTNTNVNDLTFVFVW
jgi:glycerate 2-kinase